MAARMFGPVLTHPASGRHSATLIMLHGLGDTGHGWAPIGPQLNLPHVKMMFPTAPTRPITCNMGMSMPGWFDIKSLDKSALERQDDAARIDEQGVGESVTYIKDLIAKEVAAGIPEDRIVLGGFSQGGKVALRTMLEQMPPLAAYVALSTWLESNQKVADPAILDRPLMLAHGSEDTLLPPFLAQRTYDELQRLGFEHVDFKVYPGMAHGSCYEEMEDLRAFLIRVVPDTPITADDVKGFTVRQLKRFIESQGASSRGVYEKTDLMDIALNLVPKL